MSNAFLTTDSVKMYLKSIEDIPLLTLEQEQELARQAKMGCEESRSILIESNLRLVVSIAKKYKSKGITFTDLIQEGTIGMIKSLDNFDYTRGNQFSTYATFGIKQHIIKAISQKTRNIRISTAMNEAVNRYSRVKSQLVQDLGREVTDEEMSAELEVSLDKIITYKRILEDTVSLDTPVGDEENALLSDFIEDETINIEKSCVDKESTNNISQLLSVLTERESQVVCLRYGIGGTKSKTLAEVGAMFHLTKERIRQIEIKAIEKLRENPEVSSLLG